MLIGSSRFSSTLIFSLLLLEQVFLQVEGIEATPDAGQLNLRRQPTNVQFIWLQTPQSLASSHFMFVLVGCGWLEYSSGCHPALWPLLATLANGYHGLQLGMLLVVTTVINAVVRGVLGSVTGCSCSARSLNHHDVSHFLGEWLYKYRVISDYCLIINYYY